MIQCHFSDLEQQVMEAYGSFLIADDEAMKRANAGIFDDEQNKLAKEASEHLRRFQFLQSGLPQTSTLFVGQIYH